METESDGPLAPEGVSAPRPRVPDESEADSRGAVQGRSLGQSDTFHVRDESRDRDLGPLARPPVVLIDRRRSYKLWLIIRQIFASKSGCQQMASILEGVEISPKIAIACVGCTNVTDRRQTDGR